MRELPARRGPILLAAAFALAGAMPAARADIPNNEDLVCRPDQPELDKYGYLRALSLDLRGNIPTVDEMSMLDGQRDVPDALVDQYLGSEEFVSQVVRRHRDLLWNNVGNVDIISFRQMFSAYNYPGGSTVYWRATPGRLYRGLDVPCDDVAATINNGVIKYRIDQNGYKREGWVMVEPYWAPGIQIKVCAFDAQAYRFTSTGTDCSTTESFSDEECGCGPNLRWCSTGTLYAELRSWLGKEVEMRIAAVIRGDLPYTELFTGNTAYVNGPMVHFYRHQANLNGQVSVAPVAVNMDRLPDLKWTDKDFVKIELGPEHGGILTSPAYLLRFQTYRARANRFFDSFLCQPYQPPPGGLPSPSDACSAEPDLQNRCGCKFCHSLLEPAGAHWGRWGNGGGGYLNPTDYPRLRPDCLDCAISGRQCTADCRSHYVTRALSAKEKPFLGTLGAYYFIRPEHEVNIEQGPRLLALSTIVDGRLPNCTARRTAEWLLGRELDEEEKTWVAQLSTDFVSSNYSYRKLVKAVIAGGAYRRVR